MFLRQSALKELLDRSRLERAQTRIDVLEVKQLSGNPHSSPVWKQGLDDATISPYLTVVACFFPSAFWRETDLAQYPAPSTLRVLYALTLTSNMT